jgi:hypothetical protein
MQKVVKLINPMSNVNPRNSNALPPPVKLPKLDKDGNKIKPIPSSDRVVENFATFSEAGFKSETEMEFFKKNFLTKYIMFTLCIIQKTFPVIA